MAQFDTIIKSGLVTTAEGQFCADLGIRDGRIVSIADMLTDADRVIDAEGMLVCPGGIDIHTHLDTPLNGSHTLDDWYQGTVSAACGGVTCVVDFPKQEAGHSLHEIVEKWKQKAGPKAVIDYSFSPVITQYGDDVYAEIPSLVEEGFPGFKVYMAYWHRIGDHELIKMLDVIHRSGGILGVHCENDWAADYLIEDLLAKGKTEPKYFPQSRPPVIEQDAVERAIHLARLVDAELYIVHTSCQAALEVEARARAEKKNIYVETCPHFLTTDDSVYDQPLEEAAKYVITPPLRKKTDIEALWQGISSGTVDLVSSDHCAFPYQDKLRMGRENFSTIPHGAPGVEARIPLVFSEGVSKGRISASKFVEIVSTNPAKLAGMYPQKGTLSIGSDADIMLIDPTLSVTLSTEQMHSNCDFSPYDGFRVKGYPVLTMSRGDVVYEKGRVLAARGRGKLVFRSRFQPF